MSETMAEATINEQNRELAITVKDQQQMEVLCRNENSSNFFDPAKCLSWYYWSWLNYYARSVMAESKLQWHNLFLLVVSPADHKRIIQLLKKEVPFISVTDFIKEKNGSESSANTIIPTTNTKCTDTTQCHVTEHDDIDHNNSIVSKNKKCASKSSDTQQRSLLSVLFTKCRNFFCPSKNVGDSNTVTEPCACLSCNQPLDFIPLNYIEGQIVLCSK